MRNNKAVILLLTAWLPIQSWGDENLEFSGSLAGEMRWFVHDAQFDDQLEGVQASIAAEPEWFYEPDADHQFSFVPFARVDARDDERTHVDVREAYWRYVDNEWEVVFGINREFWGVTESRHLVNIINQIDQVENIDEEDFLGQLMLNVSVQKQFGRFSLFVLPVFRERTFAGSDGRLRSPLVVDEDAASYDSDAEEWHTDFAIRYSHFFGEWDVGLSYFYGTGREPTLIPDDTGTRLIPHYDLIHQVGLDLQYTRDEWLWKLEGIVREGQGDTFFASVVGFEYTFFQLAGNNADLGVLMEHLYDGRDSTDVPVSVLENDLFFGLRYTLNDINDSSVLAGAIVDLEDESRSFRVEAERRIGNLWKAELESQWFSDTRADSLTAAFRDDDFTLLRISRFF